MNSSSGKSNTPSRTPMTKDSASRIQSAADRNPSSSTATTGFKERSQSTADKKANVDKLDLQTTNPTCMPMICIEALISARQHNILWDSSPLDCGRAFSYGCCKGVTAFDEHVVVLASINEDSLVSLKDRLTRGLGEGLAIAITLVDSHVIVFLDDLTVGFDVSIRLQR
ncbi:hypothetical protein BC939DRAFT_533974 [Gamsiella multidivaricata]|uniref:uncharacterized protein n=1 Tax=Gamsiella multidivaricata TaxID=101098 RepID=UPI00221E6B54|nr:uncharacterized protein BC939DRAFT_533974 [Gamsiella multidivaricata]KAI7815922.1 hypothetical protein BC939DRAFT_533974 [Gamsiella multidivaricata]